MESGGLNNHCPESLDSDDDVDLDSVNISNDGCIAWDYRYYLKATFCLKTPMLAIFLSMNA